MNKKIAGITGAIIATLGLTGTFATDTGQKIIKCTSKDIQYEQGDEYYCASNELMESHWKREEKKFKDNKTTKEDYVFLDLIAKNDPVKRKVLENDLILKYNPKTKMFSGGSMGADFNFQLQFAGILGSLACGDGCELIGDTMDERIYNLLNKK